MGKIKKVPSDRHTATASPEVISFVDEASSSPLHQLVQKLAQFPARWDNPRGDIYHWIPLLDRFDTILELFNKEYGLDQGPQTQPFGKNLLQRGDGEEPASGETLKDLSAMPDNADQLLVEEVLRFTRMLLERCGNRSLYASSSHINDLLHTTSLTLLQACLKLSLRLAQRYQVARFKNPNQHSTHSLMASHYSFNLDNLQRIATATPKPVTNITGKQKDKSSALDPQDLVAIASGKLSAAKRRELSEIDVNQKRAVPTNHDRPPSTPTPIRRSMTPGDVTTPAGQRGNNSSNIVRDSYFPPESESLRVSANTVHETAAYDLVKQLLTSVDKERHYEILQAVRAAKAFSEGSESIQLLIQCRLLAIGNLAYALSDSKFHDKIAGPDNEEPRQYHLAQQLCDLLQPTVGGAKILSVAGETIVLDTLEALAKTKSKQSEVVDALAVSVNHGVLYYELRRAIASLKVEAVDTAEGLDVSYWRSSVFDLVTTVSQINVYMKCADRMVNAGIIEILVEALTIRTASAERIYGDIIAFLTSFVHGISTAFQALVNVRGFEIISELANQQTVYALEQANAGKGMTEEKRSKVVDYRIPYYQQATLRSIFKFIVYLFDHNGGANDRVLRNLLDSSQTLSALRIIIANAHIFGSNVWDAAINTVSQFIHNEPTSFQVIAEAGLARGILETVLDKPLPSSDEASTAADENLAAESRLSDPKGILPVSETICDVPTAFGAICLNEEGMRLFRSSGALDAYFDIFLSPAHVQVFEEEMQTAFTVGNAFDELSRHHPDLKDEILDAVVRMLTRVSGLANDPSYSASSRLYTGADGELGDSVKDIEEGKMTRADFFTHFADPAPALPYISTCLKFLEGFLNNSSMCQKFCRLRGAHLILDIALSPGVPYDFTYSQAYNKAERVLHRMCEEKPHLVLPSIIGRTLQSIEALNDYAHSNFTIELIRHATDRETVRSISTEEGRSFIQALVNLGLLCNVLSGVFVNSPFGVSRNNNTNTILSNLRFADAYVQILSGLGKLESACIWDDLELLSHMPDVWKIFSEHDLHAVVGFGECVTHHKQGCMACRFEGTPGIDEMIEAINGSRRVENIPALKNLRTIRFLLNQIPRRVNTLYSHFSASLAPKRIPEGPQRQNLYYMAEKLADTLVDLLAYRRAGSSVLVTESYLHHSLRTVYASLLKLGANAESFTSKEALTLVLWKFYNAGGFKELDEYLTACIYICSYPSTSSADDAQSIRGALNMLLSLYSQVTSSKVINDASQSSVITKSGTENPEYFSPNEFLVELRQTVMRSVASVWRSADFATIGTQNAKLLVEIVRNILRADGEDRAARASDKLVKTVRPTTPVIMPVPDHESWFSRYDAQLATEAVYRCSEQQTQSVEYNDLLQTWGGPRFPRPSDTVDQDAIIVVDSTAEQDHASTIQKWQYNAHFPAVTHTIESKEAFITVEDLDKERIVVREDLIDRCLDILSTEPTITFELADLIQAAVAKSGEAANPRAEIGKTLVSSLLSLQGEVGDERTAKKITGYAHLVALILQDRDFFDSTLDELKEYFDSFVAWIKLEPDQNAESAPWINMILLILERILAEDEQPVNIEWTPPPADNPTLAMPDPEPFQPAVSAEHKSSLFDAIMELLPRIGKDHSLALSVMRVLVILTRNRSLASRLENKLLMSKLFLMVRQTSLPLSEKLQSAFMIVLRHVIEDDIIIERIMRTEIQTFFETARSGSSRLIDTGSYLHNLHHLVLRDSKIFAKVTKDIVEIKDFNGSPARPQQLVLKKAIAVNTDESGSAKLDQSTEPTAEIPAQSDHQMPTNESTDGVVHFLLRELSNFREVDDKPVLQKSSTTDGGNVNAPADEDVEMQGAQRPSEQPAQSDSPAAPAFKTEENVIYIYRCFLLQCLAELLACYSRCKIDFINFSRKSEGIAVTPSKPRSGTTNYLLNQLLPLGTLEHVDTSAHRKKAITSDWATTVLVALCSQTHEQPYFERHASRTPELKPEEPQLAFVRRFVLEHALRCFKDAVVSTEEREMRYSRMLALADLFDRMLSAKQDRSNPVQTAIFARSAMQMGRLMYEKNFVSALTSSIAEIDLDFPMAKRAVKHILIPLKNLTSLAVDLSQRGDISSNTASTSSEGDDISSATSVSDAEEDEEREQTPDLFRNSALSMFEASADNDEASGTESDEDDEDDEEMYDDEFEPDMGYEDGNGETVSDEDEIDGLHGIGPIEGLPGDVNMEIQVIHEDDEIEEDDSSSSGSDDDDDDEMEQDDDVVDEVDDDDVESHPSFIDGMGELEDEDDNASMAEMEGVWDEGAAYADLGDGEGQSPHDNPLDHLAHVLGEDDHFHTSRIRAIHEMQDPDLRDEHGDQDDGEEDDDEEVDGDLAFEPEADDDDEDDMRWGIDLAPPRSYGGRMHHHRNRGMADGFENLMSRVADLNSMPMRYHARGAHGRVEDEGLNPLLQRGDTAEHVHRRDHFSLLAPMPPGIFSNSRRGLREGPHSGEAILGEFLSAMHRYSFLPHNDNISRITVEGNGALMEIDPARPWRESVGLALPGGSRSSPTPEAHAVEFKPAFTAGRWEDESRILFGAQVREKATRVLTTILAILMPPAMEVKRIKDEEEAAKKKEAEDRAKEEAEKAEADRKEREAQEQKEREEREARQAREAEEARAQLAETVSADEDTAMQDVEQSDAAAASDAAEANPEPDRVLVTIRGRQIDITDLGIDIEYLQALPDDMRDEVIMGQLTEQRSQARQAGEAPEEISPEFLEALPPEIQQELLRQEAIERRRREREARRHNADNGQPPPAHAQAHEMDPQDFLAMLEPGLRQQILIDAQEDEGVLNSLPEEVRQEARLFRGPSGIARRMIHANNPRIIEVNVSNQHPEQTAERSRPKQIVQLLDKPGVATLLRLMFVHLHHKAKTSLHAVLSDVCKNTQNRAEVISILLTILQECTADVNAVEKSFAQLSLRARQPGLRTPQPHKRGNTGDSALSTELSPLTIVQHCLGTLAALSADNPKVQTFFLSEHETLTSQKAKHVKKVKGKDIRSSKYPLNALLTLLDRKLVTENTGVMETLAALLSRVTLPLQILLKKAKEAQDVEKPAEADSGETAAADPMEISTIDVRMQEAQSAPDEALASAEAPAETSAEKKKRSPRELEPPNVPEDNIRLVVNILAARECPSKTFSDTLDIIKHMAAIPGAKEVFGRELIRQAQDLGADAVNDLQALSEQITTAQGNADIQGAALASFSSSGSKQRKLLRILVALDHLFDARRVQTAQSGDTAVDAKLKGDILAALYESDNFRNLWKTLSDCLTAIRQRNDMISVATILLPLIESLMVVCRNGLLKDAPLNASQAEITVSTPPPEASMEGLFFTFTEEHRKILNELIRHNPKLMNGNLSILAKNSKVLEFDNKRSYFNRKLHSRTSEARTQHPPLTLNVRRDHAFMDSYKALYYKSGDEIKYGKLNVRFSGEEGIDAGGVSREWMAVLSRQMFNPDYALFNPVASDRTTFHPNSLSDVNTEHLSFFKFIGRIIGKALYEGRVLDCHFTRAVYRRILGKSVSLKDMETLDLEYYKSLVWILENDITDITFETFSVEVDRFGELTVVDLIENGRNIPVTEENKHEYVRLVTEHRLVKSVKDQLDAFLGGFHDIIPSDLVSIFNEQELELLISGLPNIDVDDWKNNTEYHNFTSTSAQIQWFWRAVKSFDDEERAKLLQFVTGTSKVPLNGFKELEGMNGFARFNIHRDYSSKDRLPTSHTCFNQLDLPEYESYEQLRQQLHIAITAGSEYFGFA